MPLLGAFIAPHPPLIIPAIGKGEEKKIQKTIDAYFQMGHEVAALRPETIIVISPHSIVYEDYIHISPSRSAAGDFGRFGAKGVSIAKDYDTAFVDSLCEAAKSADIPAGTFGERDKSLDHGVLVPLSFVEPYYTDYKLVRISISGLNALTHYRFGQCIAKVVEKLCRRTVIIASGDLSHKLKEDGPYGFAAEGPDFDKQITEAMAEGDFMRFLKFNEEFSEAAAECGLRSFIEMAGALDSMSVKPTFLSYEGTFGVGYAVCLYAITGSDESRNFGTQFEQEQRERLASIAQSEDEYVRLARLSLETYLKDKVRLDRPEGLSNDLINKKAGVFVSLKKDGRLRGCIGTISAVQSSVADEIIHNAVSAGLDDPRFDPVNEDELSSLVYSVDVLSEAEPISSPAELDVKRYGVIVTLGSKRGLLLPNLEGVDTPDKQIKIALQKAGIDPHEQYTMERFEVVRHK
jgi:AmmeMemoRadiSam system protein A/AmmeMemoRadiSam system protein B